MKPISVLIAVASLCIQGVYCNAQDADAKPTPPPGPLIQRRAPDFSQWIITTHVAAESGTDASADGPTKGAKMPEKTVVITKTGNIINTAIVGKHREVWSVWNDGSLHLVVAPDGKEVGEAARPLDPDAVNPYFLDYTSTDFPGFEWVSVGNYQDLRMYQGRKCLIFKRGDLLAYIDEETRYPFALVNGEGIHLYQFQHPPAAMLKLPANVQKYLDDERNRTQSLANKKIAPF